MEVTDMRHKIRKPLLLLCLAVLAGAGAYLYLRPVPAVAPLSQIAAPPKTQAIALPWPTGGQAAIGAQGYSVLATNNTDSAVPIASIAKVITALAVLKQKPLAAGAQGPMVTLDGTDVDYFNYYLSNDGSAAKVTAGEQISEYRLLQGMLIPSANNMADSLARWAFGSTDAYVTYANQMLKDMGINHTTVGDTSGFSDTTTSTADDLVKIGLSALSQPVIADVVNQKTANIPVAGDIKNVNFLLGSGGIIGIKTGNTDKAGGCYLFAAKRQILGKTTVVVGAVLGQPGLKEALLASVPLLNASDSGFQRVTVANNDVALGKYKTPWGAVAELRPARDLSLVVWKGKDIKIVSNFESVTAPLKAGLAVGSVSAQSAGQSIDSALIITQDLPGPSWHWRLFHR